MTGIERLAKLVEDICPDADPILYDILEEGTEPSWGVDQESRRTLSEKLADILVQIRRELAASGLDSFKRAMAAQSMNNIAETVKEGVNDIAERLGISDEIQTLPISDVCPRIVEELGKRLMPKGIEWPRYEDGEPVRFGDELPEFAETIYKTAKCITFNSYGYVVIDNAGGSANVNVILKSGERVKRPQVIAADGETLEAGQTVWHLKEDEPHEWTVLKPYDEYDGLQTVLITTGDVTGHARPDNLTHHRPVLDTDYVIIREGDTVFMKNNGRRGVVRGFDGELAIVEYDARDICGSTMTVRTEGRCLTHTKPKRSLPDLLDMFGILEDREDDADSWERIEEDALNFVEDNSGIPHSQDQMERDILDLVRRCKELAERGEQ